MNRILILLSIAVFSIFLGSQITEGCLLVPYWKSLSTSEFYDYYFEFGPNIGKYYSILTIIAALIPVCFSFFCFYKKSRALKYSLSSAFFAILVISLFYFYFKDANQQFYAKAFDSDQLKSELVTWGRWHWLRVVIESITLTLLIVASSILTKEDS